MHHQPWFSSKKGLKALDRRCSKCSERTRVLMERSGSGQGRTSDARVWIRPRVGEDALIQEAHSRNRALKDAVKRGVEGQSDLPPIWGADWRPGVALEFSKPLSREVIRSEILRFVTERWEGHLNLVASVLESNLPTKTMDGDDFHNWSELFLKCLYEAFDERLHDLEVGDVLEMEIIPRRDGRMYLSRRRSRFILDIRLTLRRLAHSAAVTIEQRLKWHRWMIRTKILTGT